MKECCFGVRDQIVRDSLDSLSVVEGQLPLVVGGLAVQLHASNDSTLARFSRRTPDLDILPSDNLRYEDFLSSVFPKVSEFLRDNGYTVQPKRGRNNHTVIVKKNENKPDHQSFLVHWLEYPEDLYAKLHDYFDRQINASREFSSPSKNTTLKVEALEELIPLKVGRTIRFGRNRPGYVGPLYDVLIRAAERHEWGPLSEIPLIGWADEIYSLQKEISEKGFPSTDEHVKTYKLNKDLYDLCLSARVILSDNYQPAFDTEAYSQNLQRIIFHKQFPEDRQDDVAP